MKNYEALTKALETGGYAVSHFATAQEAVDYLDSQIDGVSVGFGGSMTVKDTGLYSRLASHNETFWHWEGGTLAQAEKTDVYISSVNGLAETGEIINIDGNCNRVSSTMYGHKKVYLIVGSNKIAPDYDSALWRARNIAAPKRAQSMGKKTPCAVNADKCYNCSSPDRICRALTVLWHKPMLIEHFEVVLVDQELGF